jgi:hypothetical protein
VGVGAIAGEKLAAEHLEVSHRAVQEAGHGVSGEDVQDDQLNLCSDEWDEGVGDRLRGYVSSFEGSEQAPELAGGDTDDLGGGDHNWLVGVLDDVERGTTSGPPASWCATGADHGGDDIGVLDGLQDGLFDGSVEDSQGDPGPGGEYFGSFGGVVVDVDGLDGGIGQSSDTYRGLEYGAGGGAAVEDGEDGSQWFVADNYGPVWTEQDLIRSVIGYRTSRAW